MLQRYGVRYACEIPHVQATANTSSALAKSHKTKCKNGTYKRSHLEVEFGLSLGLLTSVQTQVSIPPMYSIDFYLPEFTCYIQFDGVSWHGLNDRRSQNAKYNRIVTQKFKTDRALDTLTPLCNLRLIRVTDLWYKAHRSEAATVVRDLAQDTTWVGVRYVGEHFDFLRSA